MVMSDFRPEVEIWPFRACAIKTCNITVIIETVQSLWGRYHVPDIRYHVPRNVFLVLSKILFNYRLSACTLVVISYRICHR